MEEIGGWEVIILDNSLDRGLRKSYRGDLVVKKKLNKYN